MAELTLILLPGLDGTGLLFGPLVAALPPNIRPVAMQYPLDRVLSYAELAEHVIQQLPRDERILLLGESFGGPLAAMLAARGPPGLVGLVLCATFVTSPRPILGPLLRPLAREWPFRFLPVYRRVRGRFGGGATPGTWGTAISELGRLVRPAVVAARVRMTLSVDARDALRDCPVPILYLRATRDGVVPRGNLRRVRRVRPDVSVATVASSHQVLQRRPAECVAAIVDFASHLQLHPG